MAQVKRFFEIDLLMTTSPDVDPDWESTKFYSRSEVSHWITQLHDIQRLNANRGLDYDAFHSMRHSSNAGEKEMGHTHHKFYDHGDANNDHVKAYFDGQTFKVDGNGRHRVHEAQHTQLRWMPAEVSAEAELMATAQRHGRQSTLHHPSDRVLPSPTEPARAASNQSAKPVWERQPGTLATPQRKASR